MKRINKYLLLPFIGIICILNAAFSQVTSNNPSLTIETCSNSFPTGNFILNDLVFSETLNSDFTAGGLVLSIQLPANFEFDTSVIPTLSETGNDVTSISYGSFPDNQTLAINLDITGIATVDNFTIAGLAIKGLTTVTASSPITFSSSPANLFNSLADGSTIATVSSGSLTVSGGTANSDQTLCLGDSPAELTITGASTDSDPLPVPSETYQWYSSPNNSDPWTSVSGAIGASYTPPAISSSSYYRREIILTRNGFSCTDFSSSVFIELNQIQAGTILGDQTICLGTDPANIIQSAGASGSGPISFQWQSKIALGIWTDIGGANLANYDPPAILETTQYQRIDTSTKNGEACSEISNVITVSVLQAVVGGTAQVSPGTADQTICAGTLPAPITVSGSSGATTYQWYSTTTSGSSYVELAGEVSETLTLSAAPSSTTYYVRKSIVNGTGDSCDDFSSESAIFVNDVAPGVISDNQTICVGTTANGLTSTAATGIGTISYQWENSIDGGTNWNPIATATQANYSPGVVNVTTQYRREDISTLNTETCEGYTNIITITVLSSVDGGTSEIAPGTADQTICPSDIPADIEVNGASGGTSYQWESSTDNVTFNPIPGEVSESLSFSSSLAQTTYYQRKSSAIGTGSSCVDLSTVSTVFVNEINAGTIGSNQTICNGTTAAVITENTPTTHAGTLTYRWETKVDPGAWILIPTAVQANYAPGIVGTTTHFRRTDISTLNGEACEDASNTITITILPAVAGGTAEVSSGVSDQTICVGDIPADIDVSGASGATDFQWQSSTNNIDFTNIPGEISASLSFSGSPAVTTFYQRSSSIAGTGSTCDDLSTVSTVFINNITAGTINGEQIICNGSPAASITEGTAAIHSGTLTHIWQSKTGAGAWTPIPTETQPTIFPGAIVATTQYRREDISTLNGKICSAYTNAISVSVLAATNGGTAEISPGVSNQTICETSIPATIDVTGSTGSTSYQWQLSTDNITFNDIPGEVSPSLIFSSAPSQTSYYQRRTINDSGGTDCSELSTVAIVFINKIQPGVIGNDQTICNGDLASNLIEVTAAIPTDVLGMQWQSKIASGSWTDIGGETTATYAPGALTETTQFRRIDRSTLNTITCFAYTNTITIEVLPLVSGGTASADETLCETDIPATINVTGAAGVLGQWQKSATGADPWTNITGETGTSLNFITPLTETTYFRREVSTIINTFTCTAYSNTVIKTFNVMEAGTIGTEQTVCFGDILPNFSETTPATFAGTISYQWQSKVGAGAWTDIGGAIGVTYSPGAMTQTTQFRRVDTSLLNTISCSDISNEITITVSGTFDAGTAGPATQTVCQGGDPSLLTVTGGTTIGVTFQWFQSTDGGATFTPLVGETGPAFNPFPGITTSTYYKRETISDVPAVTCSNFTNPVFVEVINFDAGQISGDQTVCGGSAPATFTNVAGATSNGTLSYSWEQSTNLIDWTTIGGETGETYSAPALAQTTFFRRIAEANMNGIDCSVPSNVSGVYVNQFTNDATHQISMWYGSTGPIPVCYNYSPGGITENFRLESTLGSAISYQWQSSPDNAVWADLPGAVGTTFNPPNLTADIFYRRLSTTTMNGVPCTITSNAIKFVIGANLTPGEVETTNPNSIGASTQIEVVPYGQTPSLINETTAAVGDGSIYRYLWYISTDGMNFSPAPGTNDQVDYQPTQAVLRTTWFRRVTYNTYSSFECGAHNANTLIQILVPSPGTLNEDQTICAADDPDLIESDPTITTIEGTAYLSYQWESSIDNIDFTAIPGATTINYNPAAGDFTQTSYLRRVTHTIIGGADQGVISYSETDVVTINLNIIAAGSISDNQNICHNIVPADLNSTGLPVAVDPAPTYEWWSSNDDITYSIILGATGTSYSFTDPLTQSTYYKRRDISTVNGLACFEFTNAVFIEVTEVEGGSSSPDQTVCSDEIPATIEVTGAIGAFAQWEQSTDGATWTDVVGQQSTDLAFSASIAQTTEYRRRTWSSLSGTNCLAYSPVSIVYVNNLTAGVISDNQLLCYNSLPATLDVVTLPTGTNGFTYQWQKNETGSWVNIVGADQLNYSPPPLTTTTIFRRNDSSSLNGHACSILTNEITIEIVPEVLGGTTNGDQTVCSTDNPADIEITGSNGTNKQWQSSPNGVDTWTNIAGETGISLAFGTPLTTTTYYRLRSWETIGVLVCERFSPVTTIHVNTIIPGVIEGEQTLCHNSAVGNLIVDTPETGSGVITYQWQKNETGSWSDIAGADQPTYSPGTLTTTTLFRRMDTSTLFGEACTLPSNVITITILPEIVGGSSNGNQTACSTEIPGNIVITGALGPNFQWESSPNGVDSWSVMAGETGSTLAFGAPIAATTFYRLHAWETIGAVTCEDYSDVVSITLNEFNPGEIENDQTLCYNSIVGNLTVKTPAIGTGVLTYQWEKNDDGNWVEILNADQPTYSPGNLTLTTLFRRKAINTENEASCSDYSNIVTISIIGELTGGTTTADQFVCLTEIPSPISTDGIKGVNAIWQKSEDMATWTDIPGFTGETLTFSAPLANTTYFRWYTWTDLGVQTCDATSTVSTVNINRIIPGKIDSDQVLCAGDVTETLTGTLAPVHSGILSHQWEVTTDLFNWNDIVGEIQATYKPNPAVTSYFRRMDISTLPNGDMCSAYTDTVKITIDDYPAIDDQTIKDNDIIEVSCFGGNDGSIVIPNSRITGGNVAERQITNIILSGTAAVNDVYTIIINGVSFTHTVILNALNNPQTNIEIAADLSTAISSSAVAVTVNNETITLTAQVAGIPFTAFASTGASVNGKMTSQLIQENKLPNIYEWSKIDDPTVISTSLSILDLTAGFYQLVVSNNLCTDTAVFEVPQPEELIVDLDTTCNNSLTAKISGGNGNYTVTLKKPDNTTEVRTTSGDVTFTGLESGFTYTIEIVDAPCTQTFTKVVTLPYSLAVDESLIDVTGIQCGGSEDGSITLQTNAITGGVEPYQYSWTVFDGALEVQIATTKDISDLAAGTYYLTVTDNLGCTATYSTTIADKLPTVITKTITNQTLSCPEDDNAAIDLIITSDPSSLLEINWFKDGVEVPALKNQLNLASLIAGKYHVDVVDISTVPTLCIVSDTTLIEEPGIFTVTKTDESTAPTCFSETYKGTVTYQIRGGTEPFTYELNGDPAITFTPDENGFMQIADLDTGVHTIIFSEENNCQEDITVAHEVIAVKPIEISYDETSDIIHVGCSLKGSINVDVTGGTPAYFYEWSGPNNFTQVGTDLNHLTGIEEIGIYTLQVTDINQCKSAPISIELVELTTEFNVIEVIRNGQCAYNNDAAIELSLSGNVIAPYTVEWEKWDLKDPANTDCTTDCYEWKPIPSASGKLLLNNIGPGEYRVTIIDGSNSVCDTYINTYSLASSSIEMVEEGIRRPDCEDSNYGYSFKMKADNQLKFFINGVEISLAKGSLIFNAVSEEYIIKNLEPNDYLLRVVEQLPDGSDGCEIFKNFATGDFTILEYTGATSHELDVCLPSYKFTLDTSLVIGGIPFIDADEMKYYNYEWTSPDNTSITGFKDIPVSEGTYQLVIKDQRGCSTDPILFNFTISYAPIEVFEEIDNVSCEANTNDGSISVTIQGGREPYSTVWEKEIVNQSNGETSYSQVATNTFSITDLSPGRYRLTVLSNFDNCNSNNPIVRFAAIYTLSKDEAVTILDGPYLSKELCGGTPGILTIQVSETDNGSTVFYYNEQLVNSSFIGEGTYEVQVDNPISNGMLNAVNENGCSTFVIIEDGVANPSFRFESEGYLQFGITAVGEELKFINTTTEQYDSLTWDFGDGSDILPLSAADEKLQDVIHAYETEGLFNVTLTVFNEAGCSNEVQNIVTIGKGYSVMFPTAFTPNGDGINDYFEGEFTGIVAFTLNIYDTWNNLIFTTSHETLNLPKNWGWDGNKADGSPFNSQVFKYIYYGKRINGEAIIKTDNAIIIK